MSKQVMSEQTNDDRYAVLDAVQKARILDYIFYRFGDTYPAMFRAALNNETARIKCGVPGELPEPPKSLEPSEPATTQRVG